MEDMIRQSHGSTKQFVSAILHRPPDDPGSLEKAKNLCVHVGACISGLKVIQLGKMTPKIIFLVDFHGFTVVYPFPSPYVIHK